MGFGILLLNSLPDFFARYPDIRLEVGCSDRPVDLIEDRLDLAVRVGQPTDASLVSRSVGSFGRAAVAARMNRSSFLEQAAVAYAKQVGFKEDPPARL